MNSTSIRKGQTKTRKPLKAILILLFAVILLLTTETSAQSTEDSATNFPTTTDAELQDCSHKLDKSLTALKACRDVAASRLVELQAKDAELVGAYQQIEVYKTMVERFDKRIKYLESIKCSEFALIKIFGLKILHSKKCL